MGKKEQGTDPKAQLTIDSEAQAASLQLELADLFDSLEERHDETRDKIATAAAALKAATVKDQERSDQIVEALASFLVLRADKLEAADRAAGVCADLDRRTTAQRGFFQSTMDAAKESLEALISPRLAAIAHISNALIEFARVHKDIYQVGLQTVACTHAEFSWAYCPEVLQTISTARDAEEDVARDVYQRDRRERFRLLRYSLREKLKADGQGDNTIDVVLDLITTIVDLWEESVTVYGQMLTADQPKLDKTAIKKLANAKRTALTPDRLKSVGLKLIRETRGSWKSIDCPVTATCAAA